jgi:hypothetical protein
MHVAPSRVVDSGRVSWYANSNKPLSGWGIQHHRVLQECIRASEGGGEEGGSAPHLLLNIGFTSTASPAKRGAG